MKSARIYPLRTSSTEWKIKLYTHHICSDKCRFINTSEHFDGATIIFYTENPLYKDEKCEYYGTNQLSSVKISEFNKNIPNAIDGYLLYSEQIVIPDREIYVLIDMPIDHPIKIKIKSANEFGFTLSELIHQIKNIYQWIYTEEERTTIEQEFLINIMCDCGAFPKKCLYDKCTINYESNESNESNDNTCSICLEKIKEECAVLKCQHYFHLECIEKWIEEDGKTCPLCRNSLYEKCDKCDGKEWFEFYYKGKILPSIFRGFNITRNKTYGRFGIDVYDLEDLILESMSYNRVSKLLSLNIK